MKKYKLAIFVTLILSIVFIGTTTALAVGNDGPVIGPRLPEGEYDDDYYNVGKTKLSSPFAFSFQQILLPTDGLPDPGKGKEVFYYTFVSGAPTKVCFPQIFGSTTKVYGNSTVRWEWVKPGLRTTTEIYDSIKYRCAEVTSNGFYGLIGNTGEKFEHKYPIDTP